MASTKNPRQGSGSQGGKNQGSGNRSAGSQPAGNPMSKQQRKQAQNSSQKTTSPGYHPPTTSSQSTKTRNTVIAVLVILIVVVIAVFAWISTRSSNDFSTSSNTAQSNSNTAQSAGAFSSDILGSAAPIIVSSEGVGVRNENAPDVTMYFDFSCHACTQMETLIFDWIFEDVQAGQYNLLLHPVNTVDMPYHPVATYAAILVAEQEPTHFVEFYHELMSYFWDAYDSGDGSVVYDSTKSLTAVSDIAADLGVSQNIISQFNTTGAETYLDNTTSAWMSNENIDRGDDSDTRATPEIVANGISIRFMGDTEYPRDIYENFITSLQNAGLDVQ